MWTAKTLIRLGGCPGWSESLLGAHAILLVLSWGGLNYKCILLHENHFLKNVKSQFASCLISMVPCSPESKVWFPLFSVPQWPCTHFPLKSKPLFPQNNAVSPVPTCMYGIMPCFFRWMQCLGDPCWGSCGHLDRWRQYGSYVYMCWRVYIGWQQSCYLQVYWELGLVATIMWYVLKSHKKLSQFCDCIWAAPSDFDTYRLCEQRRFRRACASAQSRQNLRCSLIQAVSQEEPSDRKPDPWPFSMAGHARLKFVMTECSKTQIRLTRPIL